MFTADTDAITQMEKWILANKLQQLLTQKAGSKLLKENVPGKDF